MTAEQERAATERSVREVILEMLADVRKQMVVLFERQRKLEALLRESGDHHNTKDSDQ